MMVLVLWLVILFVVAFFTRRRFGLLGLALAAGAVLSPLWTEQLTQLVADNGIQLVAPPLASVVGAVLTLLPSIILLFKGSKETSMPKRVIAAALYAVLATTFLLEPLGNALILMGNDKMVFDMLLQYRVYIVTIGLTYAVFDVLLKKAVSHNDHDKGKH